MKNRLLLLFGLFLLSTPAHAEALTPREKAPFFLEVGEQRLISYDSFYKYSVSGDSLRYVRIPNQNQLLLKALKPGLATLTVFTSPSENETRTIRIERSKGFNRPSALLQAMNPLKEIEVLDDGDHFVLRGKVKTPGEASAVRNLIDRFSSYVIDETEIDSAWFERSQQELTAYLKVYPSLQLQSAGHTLSVVGGLPNATLVQAVTKRIRQIQPLTALDLQTIKDNNPTIYFKVFLLEVKKELITSLGVEWPSINPVLFQLSPAKFLVNNTLDLSVHALSEKGLVRILSSPELVVRAPGQAELFAGGELPIRQRSKYNDTILWKSVGLSLKLDVKEFGGEKVRLNVETEMSHFDGTDNDDIPGVQSNKMKTQVDAFMGKPLLLSGLLQEGLRERVRGLPMLSNLPILGKLFGSEDYQKDRSELVAILLPHRETPMNPMQRVSSEIPKGFLPLPRNFVSAHDVEDLKNDRNYPWNVL
jgi:Flp pilus assembly secretin CpaC